VDGGGGAFLGRPRGEKLSVGEWVRGGFMLILNAVEIMITSDVV
jgi:hypothetical protein